MTTMALSRPASQSSDPIDPRRRRLLPPMPTDEVFGWLAPLGVFLLALLLRLDRLAIPKKEAFDEVYYRKDAFDLLKHGYELDKDGRLSGFVVHPPLGKWTIALGEQLYGNNSFGWRISAAVFGSLSVLLVCRIGRRMFRSTLIGCIAGLLLTLDGLHFVQSRVAMLDIFLMFWVVAAFGCLVVDRDVGRARLAAKLTDETAYPGPKLGIRWWRVAAALCLGAACATKWSGLFFVIVYALLAFAWDVGARRTAGIPAPFRAALWREGPGLLLLFVGLVSVVYVGSWAGWFVTSGGWRRDCNSANKAWGSGPCGPVRGFIEYHKQIYHFHDTLSSGHTYKSQPWGWLLLARPVSYFYESPRQGTSQEILGIGTPAIWWVSIPAMFAVAWRWAAKRDWRASAILVSFAAGYLPWLYYAAQRRTMFLFYALPMVPFMCLALAMCAGIALGGPGVDAFRKKIAAIGISTYLIAVALNFYWMSPVLTARVLPYADWKKRMWFGTWI